MVNLARWVWLHCFQFHGMLEVICARTTMGYHWVPWVMKSFARFQDPATTASSYMPHKSVPPFEPEFSSLSRIHLYYQPVWVSVACC